MDQTASYEGGGYEEASDDFQGARFVFTLLSKEFTKFTNTSTKSAPFGQFHSAHPFPGGCFGSQYHSYVHVEA